MKKISLLFVGVLFCTLVFANGTDEPTSSSSVAVTNVTGSSLFKLYYTANTVGDVKISILDQQGNMLFTEKLKKTKGFVRPYNFGHLEEGTYAIQIDNEEGRRVEKVYYSAGKFNKVISIVKLTEKGKYLFAIKTEAADNVEVNIYDAHNKLIHSQKKLVDREFAEIFNLKNINEFTIEVSDDSGLLKSIKQQ
jgi:hypothetical protein